MITEKPAVGASLLQPVALLDKARFNCEEESHHVTLSGAKGLSRSAERSFAEFTLSEANVLRMTELDLAGGEELASACEPGLNAETPSQCIVREGVSAFESNSDFHDCGFRSNQ